MASDDLPSDFDIIVLGTGLTETIAAAAFSRIGLKILHLDRNDFYGGTYGNFNLDALEAWKKKNNDIAAGIESTETADVPDEVKKQLADGEMLIPLPREQAQAFNIKSQFHIRDRTEEEEKEAQENKPKPRFNFLPIVPYPTDDSATDETESKDDKTIEEHAKTETTQDESEKPNEATESNENTSSQSELTKNANENDAVTKENKENESDPAKPSLSDSGIRSCSEESESFSSASPDESANSNGKQDQTSASGDEASSKVQEDIPTEHSQGSGEQKEVKAEQSSSESSPAKEWTSGDIKDEWRRYCFDISPRVLHCSGEMVELLIQSDVARYCEFRTVSRVLTILKGNLQQVPCSRADVFSSKIVSLIEKRLMMKFLQFAAEYDKKPEEYQEYIGKPFVDFLKSKKLTANIQHFVQHSIAMVTDGASTEEGLKKTQKFLHSLGRYGNTAFLFPLYGTGELPQAFSRLSAVFGGIYCLMLSASHVIADKENKCCGIITSSGQHIKCKYLIGEMSYLPASYVKVLSNRKISRAIYITSDSILTSEESDLSLLNFVGKDDPARPVTVLELPSSACVCPKNVFVVHLTRVASGDDAEEDLREVKERLFAADSTGEDTGNKPKILWSMYFTYEDKSQVELGGEALGNVLVTSGGGGDGVDMDYCVQEAKTIFHTICPDEEFLPKPPNPEDIIHVDDTDSAVASGPSEFESKEGDVEGATDEDSTTQVVSEAESKEEKTEAVEKETSAEDKCDIAASEEK